MADIPGDAVKAFVLMTGDDREPVAVVTDEDRARQWQEGNLAERSYVEVPLNQTGAYGSRPVHPGRPGDH